MAQANEIKLLLLAVILAILEVLARFLALTDHGPKYVILIALDR